MSYAALHGAAYPPSIHEGPVCCSAASPPRIVAGDGNVLDGGKVEVM